MSETPGLCCYCFLVFASALACSDWQAVDELNANASEGGAGNTATCPESFDPDLAEQKPARHGFRVVGNEIHDADGSTVTLRGVNRSGSEYQCSKGAGFFDGQVDEQAVRAMARWNINAVRVPLNETCWLSGGNLSSQHSGENYKTAIRSYVTLLKRYGLIPILDLHWAAPGDTVPDTLWPIPNADHTVDFWTDVAIFRYEPALSDSRSLA